MSRPLRFRVWDGPTTYHVSAHDLCHGYPSAEACCMVDDLVFDQWTGLKDSRGVDIYEGDIVRRWRHRPESDQYGAAEDYPADIGTVIYVSEWGRFRVAGHRDAPFDKAVDVFADYAWTADLHDGHAFWSDQSYIRLEVLGNVHEHLHLLSPST